MIRKVSCLLFLFFAACGKVVLPANPSVPPFPTETAAEASTVIPTPTRTAIPTTITPRPSATIAHTETLREENILYDGVSPDGGWEWAVLSDPLPDGTLQTRFRSTAGQTTWIIGPSPDDPLGMEFQVRYYRPFFWLPGESYVYLEGDGCCIEDLYFFPRSLALARLDLATGKIVPWPVSYNWVDFYTFSFSPSGEYLFSGIAHQHTVQITTLRDGAVQTIPLADTFEQVGDVSWSPDGQSAAMRVCEDMNYDTTCSAVGLIVVRVGQAEFSTVVSDWVQALELSGSVREEAWYEWKDDTHLLLHGPKYNLVYNTETGVLSKRQG